MIVYHGTDWNSAEDIERGGISMAKSAKGYFGRGFYTSPNYDLVHSNYAMFSGEYDEDDDEASGAILHFRVDPGARILDLDDPDDFEDYKALTKRMHPSHDGFDRYMVNNDIDGLTDMGSIGGTVFYNPFVLTLVESEYL